MRKFSSDIERLFGAVKSKSSCAAYNPVLLTTCNILNENQLDFVCREIEKTRKIEERGTKEEILIEAVLPEFLIHLFCTMHKLTKTEALDILKTQDEYRMLFLNESASISM